MSRRIKVFIIDDSALIRQMLSRMLAGDPELEVVGTAPDPIVAQRKIGELKPDVLTLDIEMPGVDGLTFLEKIMRLRPMPVVMISTLTQRGADATVRALELGAVDVVGKPTQDLSQHFEAMRDEIVAKVKAAALARIRVRAATMRRAPDTPTMAAGGRPGGSGGIDLIAIGASTGGVGALRQLLQDLPAGTPPIVIAQHMPLGFTANFASRLDKLLPHTVGEAEDGVVLGPGRIYIAPGNRQFTVARRGTALVAQVRDDPPVGGHRPSVDALFDSVADSVGDRAIGVILTGMGRDGATGLLAMRKAGAATIGQNEATCTVYGMPRAARDLGAVDAELPLAEIGTRLVAWLGVNPP